MPPPPKNDPASAAAGAAKAPAKGEAAAETPAAPAPAPSAGRGGLMAWLPVIAVMLLAPVATWATVELVVLPRLQKKIASSPPPVPGSAMEHAPAAEGGGHGEKGKEGKGKESGPPGYEFQNVVVNLSGTMGTRYLKTNVFIVSKDPKIKEIFESDKPRLTDITQAVLAGLTLTDIEELGARNVIRAKLVNAYNEALRRKVVEEVYLTDFVVQ
jgi:flagellar protein FliL